MRGVGVNLVGALRVTVFFSFIEHTFTEAAEQTPRPRAGSAQAAGATNDHAQSRVTCADLRRKLAASCSRSRWAPAPLLSVPWRCRGHQRLIREAWQRAPLLHYGSQLNPVRFNGRSHQLVGPTIGRRAVKPPSVSAARHQGPRLFPDNARARLAVCAPVRQSQSSGGASPPRAKPLLIPMCQGAVRLVVDPAPCQLHDDATDMRIPRARNALVVVGVATLIRRRRQTDQRTEFSTVPN